MGTSETEQTSVLNPVDDPEKRPFGAPGFMYAFYSFVLSGGLVLLANYAPQVPHLVQVVLLVLLTGGSIGSLLLIQLKPASGLLGFGYLFGAFLLAAGLVFLVNLLEATRYLFEMALLFLAAGCFFESLALIFFEPSVMIGNDIVHYRAQKFSVWKAPPRMFRWTGVSVDEELDFSTFQGIELDYTRVPFPLPVFPFTRPFFHITRWILTIKRDDGTYLLLEVGPAPETFREVAKKVSEFTELPLRAPWFDGFQKCNSNSWLWKPETEQQLDGNRLMDVLKRTDLTFEEDGKALEFPVENRMSAFWRSGGLLASGACFMAGTIAVFAGFQFDTTTASGLVLCIFWMLAGAFGGLMGILLLADYVSPVRSKLRFDRHGIQVIHPVGQSSFITYNDLQAIRGVRQNHGSAAAFGFGKPVPCLEVYGKQDWFFISLHDVKDLDGFSDGLRNLT